MRLAADRSAVVGKRLVLAASDGELYGHHKKFADLTLAYLATVEAAKHDIEVTNLAAFILENPPTWEADLAKGPHGEGTAWSCPHGFGRWNRHCGCVTNAAAAPSQAWRGPMRDAFDLLRDKGAKFFEDAAVDLFDLHDRLHRQVQYAGVLELLAQAVFGGVDHQTFAGGLEYEVGDLGKAPQAARGHGAGVDLVDLALVEEGDFVEGLGHGAIVHASRTITRRTRRST